MFANPNKVVTKFQFSSLFNKVWSKGMSIDNICAGFKKTSVYPFDLEAILKNFPESNSLADVPEEESSLSLDHSENSPQESSSSGECHITPTQLNWYEEQTMISTLTASMSVTWLQKTHPESVPSIEAMLGHVEGVGK